MTAAVQMHNKKSEANLFQHMKRSLKACHNFEQRVRLAKTIAPMLCDQSSNQAHFDTLSGKSPMKDKVIALIMLGFPNNREALPVIRDILCQGPDALKMAAIIAICQMSDGKNNALLNDIILLAYENESKEEIKQCLKKALAYQLAPASASECLTTEL